MKKKRKNRSLENFTTNGSKRKKKITDKLILKNFKKMAKMEISFENTLT